MEKKEDPLQTVHFKISHRGVTKRFSLYRDTNRLYFALRGKIEEILGDVKRTILWKDDDSFVALENEEDLNVAIEYAQTQNRLLACVSLITSKTEVTVEESAQAFEGITFQCNHCDAFLAPSNGGRYKCTICPDFDFCSECFSKENIRTKHGNHAFVCLLDAFTRIPMMNGKRSSVGDVHRCTPKFVVESAHEPRCVDDRHQNQANSFAQRNRDRVPAVPIFDEDEAPRGRSTPISELPEIVGRGFGQVDRGRAEPVLTREPEAQERAGRRRRERSDSPPRGGREAARIDFPAQEQRERNSDRARDASRDRREERFNDRSRRDREGSQTSVRHNSDHGKDEWNVDHGLPVEEQNRKKEYEDLDSNRGRNSDERVAKSARSSDRDRDRESPRERSGWDQEKHPSLHSEKNYAGSGSSREREDERVASRDAFDRQHEVPRSARTEGYEDPFDKSDRDAHLPQSARAKRREGGLRQNSNNWGCYMGPDTKQEQPFSNDVRSVQRAESTRDAFDFDRAQTPTIDTLIEEDGGKKEHDLDREWDERRSNDRRFDDYQDGRYREPRGRDRYSQHEDDFEETRDRRDEGYEEYHERGRPEQRLYDDDEGYDRRRSGSYDRDADCRERRGHEGQDRRHEDDYYYDEPFERRDPEDRDARDRNASNYDEDHGGSQRGGHRGGRTRESSVNESNDVRNCRGQSNGSAHRLGYSNKHDRRHGKMEHGWRGGGWNKKPSRKPSLKREALRKFAEKDFYEVAYAMASQIPAHLAIKVLSQVQGGKDKTIHQQLSDIIQMVADNTYDLKKHYIVFDAVSEQVEMHLIGNIAVDLEKHIRAIQSVLRGIPDDQLEEAKARCRDGLMEALKQNGTNRGATCEHAYEIKPLLLTDRFTRRPTPLTFANKYVGFMEPDPSREGCPRPRVPNTDISRYGLFSTFGDDTSFFLS